MPTPPRIFDTTGGTRLLEYHNAVAKAHGEYGKEADGRKVRELEVALSAELTAYDKAKDQAGDLDQACKGCGDSWYNIPPDVRDAMVRLMETLGVDLGGR